MTRRNKATSKRGVLQRAAPNTRELLRHRVAATASCNDCSAILPSMLNHEAYFHCAASSPASRSTEPWLIIAVAEEFVTAFAGSNLHHDSFALARAAWARGCIAAIDEPGCSGKANP